MESYHFEEPLVLSVLDLVDCDRLKPWRIHHMLSGPIFAPWYDEATARVTVQTMKKV